MGRGHPGMPGPPGIPGKTLALPRFYPSALGLMTHGQVGLSHGGLMLRSPVPYTQLLRPFGAPRGLWVGSGQEVGSWDSEHFLGCSKNCFMEGEEGHVIPRLTDWELGVMHSLTCVSGATSLLPAVSLALHPLPENGTYKL